MKQTGLGVVVYMLLMVPPLRASMESIMVVHMLIQLPLLLVSGWLLGHSIIKQFGSVFDTWNANGVPGIIFFVCITTYWMIPRTLDEALTLGPMELFKFISLPLAGICLHDSWNKLQTIGKSFIFLNLNYS